MKSPFRSFAIVLAHARLPVPAAAGTSIKHITTTSMSTSRRRQQNRPRNDSPSVALSKQLSWLLRHGLDQSGLAVRKDGYVSLDELVFPLYSKD